LMPASGRLAKRRIGEKMKPTNVPDGAVAAANITQRIHALGEWRGETLEHLLHLIHDADPDIQKEWKWMGTPVWSHDGIVCTGESYKKVVKPTFARGASIKDPKKFFNASLEGNTRRLIDLPRRGEDQRGCHQQLIHTALAANAAALASRQPGRSKPGSWWYDVRTAFRNRSENPRQKPGAEWTLESQLLGDEGHRRCRSISRQKGRTCMRPFVFSAGETAYQIFTRSAGAR
jgi:hypothetical protein